MSKAARRTVGWIGSLLAVGLLLTLTGCDGITVPTAMPTALPTALPTHSPSSPSASTTLDPTSIAPTSTAPTSAPPTSAAPTSTAPTSAPPTSAAPTSAAPTSAAPTASPSATPMPAPGNGGIPWWLWLIVVAAAAGGAVALILRRTVDRTWDRRFETVRGELVWIHDQMVPQLLESPTPASAALLWRSAEPRVATVEAELRSLGAAGVSAKRTMRATHLRRLLASVTIAVEAEISLPADATADQLREAQRKIRIAQADLREGLDNGGAPPPPQRVAR